MPILDTASVCQGRLTTESGVAVSTSDRTAQSTIYWTPFRGNLISLFDGTRWKMFSPTERSLALSGLTANSLYDVFMYDNAGSPTLELGAAWTNTTTRSTALVLQNGIEVRSGATTRRYLGTIRATAATTTQDSGGGSTTQTGGKRFVWNAYNQVERYMSVIDTADTWSYTTGSWRVANGAASPLNCVEYVTGAAHTPIEATLTASLFTSNGGNGRVGIGVNSTSAASGMRTVGYLTDTTTVSTPMSAFYAGTPGLGYNYISWLERGGGSATVTFIGDNGESGATQSGMTVCVLG